MLLESDSSWLTVAGPYPMLPRLSVVQLPPALSALQPPTAPLGRVVNSHSRPLTTSGYGEISCPRILCLVSRQNRQLNRLLWQPNHIVLQLILIKLYSKNLIKELSNRAVWTRKELKQRRCRQIIKTEKM